MIKMTLTRKIKRSDLVKEYETQYHSMENLKKLLEKDPNNVEIELDLDEWEYSLTHGEEILEQTRILYDFEGLTTPDLILINLIKNEMPESITELAKMMGKDSANVSKQVDKLKEEGLIQIEEGKINNMKTPVFNYDKIEIAI